MTQIVLAVHEHHHHYPTTPWLRRVVSGVIGPFVVFILTHTPLGEALLTVVRHLLP